VDSATLSSITGDDAASGGGDGAVSSPHTDSFSSAGAGFSLNLATGTATDTAPTLGPVEDKNSATDPPTLGPVKDNSSASNENLVGTSGVGSLTAYLGPTVLHGSAPDSGGASVSPAFGDNSFHIGALGAGALAVGTLDDLMSGAGIIGAPGFDTGNVLAGAGIASGGNGPAGTGVNGFFAALTGSFSPPSAQWQDLAAGSLNIDSQLSQLVQAMATYSADSPSFASSPVAQVSNDSALFGAIAATGHG
jgi:hypothetical protein